MKNISKISISLAVITAIYHSSASAEEMISRSQLDQIVAEAVEKALAKREQQASLRHKDNPNKAGQPEYQPEAIQQVAPLAVKEEQPVIKNESAPTPDIALPYGFKFSAYARYGAHFQGGDQKYIGVDGSYNGTSAIGRLGNEGNGGEYQFSQTLKAPNGAIWDANIMFDHWSDEVNLKKAYVGVTNLFSSQPNAYLWAGRDFHQRPAQDINDYQWMSHDGQGAGIKNFDINGVLLDIGAVGSVESCDPQVVRPGDNPSRITCTGASGTNDKGNYALTSKVYGLSLGGVDVALYANYGFDSKSIDKEERTKAWQGAVVLSHTTENSKNELITRYSDNSDNSVYNKTESLRSTYVSFDGTYTFTPKTMISYLLAYHDYDVKDDNSDSRKNYAAIVRPMYFWNEVHSTWLEAGYQRVNFDEGGDNKGWKLTLSQNVSFDMGPNFRPMLRFYVTGGEVENQHTTRIENEPTTRLDSFNVGAMWEAWF